MPMPRPPSPPHVPVLPSSHSPPPPPPPPPPKKKKTLPTKLGFYCQLQCCLLAVQVVLEFPQAFWASDFDYFGAAVDGGPELRGRCFMFWNCLRLCGAPILTSIVSGGSSYLFPLHWVPTLVLSSAPLPF